MINPNEKYPVQLPNGDAWPIEKINKQLAAIVASDVNMLLMA